MLLAAKNIFTPRQCRSRARSSSKLRCVNLSCAARAVTAKNYQQLENPYVMRVFAVSRNVRARLSLRMRARDRGARASVAHMRRAPDAAECVHSLLSGVAVLGIVL
jgi:hypothetical protein